MAQRTYTTTPVREVGLSAAVAAVNKDIQAKNDALAKQDPPGTPLPLWTNDTYFAARIDDVLDSWASQHMDTTLQQAMEAFMAAPQDKQGQILSLLGLADYASLPPASLGKVLGTIGLSNFLALTKDQQNEAFTLAGLTS